MKALGITIDGNGVNLGGLQVFRTAVAKAAVGVTNVPAEAVGTGGGVFGPGSRSSVWGVIRESFAGAWQKNVTIDSTEGILAFSAVYSCIDLIAKDISKLRPRLVQLVDGIWPEITNPAYSPVLRKPNSYQTRIQFFSAWITSKLIFGNTVVLKERDQRGVVTGLHVLNWRLVRVLVAEDGSVYYGLSNDKLAGVQSITVPASEIIHDRGVCLFHPLVGIPPIYACGMSASQGNRIQNNASKFFENMSRPSGMLTAPEEIPDETAIRLKADFEANFSGMNLGRLLVAGSNLKYEAMTIPAQQAQLIEQLKWTVQDVASCFHVPLHKIASDSGVKYANMAEMNQDYFNTTLSELLESIEVLLDEGLGLSGDGNQTMGISFDTSVLLRLDPVQRSTIASTAIKAGYLSPNEARRPEDLPPVKGGEFPMMQQQNFPLPVLADQPAPGSVPPPAPAPAPDPNADTGEQDPPADPAKSIADAMAEFERVAADAKTQIAKEIADRKAALERAEAARQRDVEQATLERERAAEKLADAERLREEAFALQQEADAALAATGAIKAARDTAEARASELASELEAAHAKAIEEIEVAREEEHDAATRELAEGLIAAFEADVD